MDAADDNGSEMPSDGITDNITDPTPSASASASASASTTSTNQHHKNCYVSDTQLLLMDTFELGLGCLVHMTVFLLWNTALLRCYW